MPSYPFNGKHGEMTSGVACHHRLWAAQKVGPRQALHAIIAFVQHRKSNDVGRGMPSSPLGSTHGRTTSGVACHHRLWAAHTIERRRVRHAITAIRKHTQSYDVERDMLSLPLESTDGRTTSGVAFQYHLWAAQTVERHRAWHAILPLESTHGRTTSGVA